MTLGGSQPNTLPATAFGHLGSTARGASTSSGSSCTTATHFQTPSLPSPRPGAERVARLPAGATQGGPSTCPLPTGRRSFRAGCFSSAATGRRMTVFSSPVIGGRHLSAIALPPDYGRRHQAQALACAGRIFGMEHLA